MRLIQNMSTIAEYPSTECASSRVIKMAVIGGSGVGKTALVVRFLTKRFIGDYERNVGNLYSREVQIDGEQVAIQVQDTPGVQVNANGRSSTDHVARAIQWADAVVMVYSVTDCRSFDLIGQLHQLVSRTHTSVPIILVANKADLLHIRRVDAQEGPLLASALGCSFYEVSASEDYSQVHGAFHRLCVDLAKQQPPLVTPINAASSGTEKKRSPLIPRPKSPNMQDLKRRFKQVLSAKVRTVTSV
ncbi:ras-like protein family member 11B [Triplophysa dalaica]|uniref:ras-like protein family member 11B n=1 Tax=Triplophysa dalaica TaxID=1582913 RepID=UPI0024DF5F2C|nr:ras-like protein family member 11B [Triplophysa dalaica]